MAPNFIFSINIGHITSTLALFVDRIKISYNLNVYSVIFFAYLTYLAARLMVYFLFNIQEVIFDDFSELKRIILLLLAYLIAKRSNIEDSKLITIFFAITIILYVANISIYNGGHRFSSFMPSVNYIWVAILFLILKGENIVTKYDTIILSVIALGLSASLTSVFVSFALLLVGLVVYKEIKIYKIGLTLIVVGLVTSGFIMADIFSGFIYQSQKFTTAYQLLISGEITQFNTFQMRQKTWAHALILISDNPIFGYGVSKDLLRYTDNQYLLTLFRYGFIGLMLEICFLSSLLYRSYIQNNMLIFLFVIGLFISGYTANSIYEIKIIPILGILAGELFKYK